MNDVPGPIRMAINGAALLLLWLLIVGAVTYAPGRWGWVALTVALAGFIYFHAILKRPTSVVSSRQRAIPIPLFLAFAVPLSLVLVTADIFWLIGRDQLQESAEPTAVLMVITFLTLFPLLEEFGFRLWIQTPLEQRLPRILAVVLVALAFAMLHSADGPLPQLVTGIILGLALIATQSIWFCVAMHSLLNALVLSAAAIPGIQPWSIELAEASPLWVQILPFLLYGLCLLVVAWWYRHTMQNRAQLMSVPKSLS